MGKFDVRMQVMFYTKEEMKKAELDAQLDKAIWELEEYLDYTGAI